MIKYLIGSYFLTAAYLSYSDNEQEYSLRLVN